MEAMPSVSEVIYALVAKRNSPDSLPPMTIVDGRLCQDGGIPLPPYYLG